MVDYEIAQEKYCSGEVDVLIVDVYEDSDHESLRGLFEHFKASKILVITPSLNEWFLSSLLHLGANGLFITTDHASKLSEAICVLNRTGIFLPDNLVEKLHCEVNHKMDLIPKSTIDDEDRIELDALTSREIEILKLMVKGEPSSQIAGELFISESTVFTHRKHILKKLGFNSTPVLIRCALEQGVI